MDIDERTDPPEAAPRGDAPPPGGRAPLALAWAALACASLLTVLAGWGSAAMGGGGGWGGYQPGEFDAGAFVVELGFGVLALLGAAGWLVGERRGGEGARWGAAVALVAFGVAGFYQSPFALLFVEWGPGLMAWASVGGFATSAAGLWLGRRRRPASDAAARPRPLLTLLLFAGLGLLLCVVLYALLYVLFPTPG